MRLVENETRLTMNKRRNFVNYADMTLSDGTVLHLTPSDFRISGQSFTDDWVDGEAFQIGTAIGKIATLLLDNTDGRTEEIEGEIVTYPHGKFSEYDFYMAYFVLYVCLPEAYHYEGELKDQMIRIGTFTVTTPTAHGSTIEITGVDNMYMFDKSFDDCDLDFSTNPTLLTILNTCCEDCGVAIGYGSFNNQNLTVNKKPEGVTYRQVVSYIALIAGCNAKISDTGALILRWYDTSVFADNWLDGGSFTAIGEEYKHRTILYDGLQKNWGYIIRYRRPDESGFLPRSGRYRLTRLYVYNISDPSNFDADYEIMQYDSVNYGINRFNDTTIIRNKLLEGDNIINYEFDISTLNSVIYWFGVVGNNYGDTNAATFDCDIYLEPVSYDDLDSADGGTFETEFQFYNTTHWVYEGQSTSTGTWSFYRDITYQFLKPAGRYNITRTFVDNIADPAHFNAIWIVQKSVDNGSTWTDEATGNLVAGDNEINFDVDIPENIETRFRVGYRQNVTTDPDASDFDATLYMKANDVHYLDGDNFDGGDFATPLNYHNLISTNGTSVSTDDIQFTGVLVQGEDTSAHYPTYDGWDNYAMVISDNPFVAGYEDTIALYIYSQLQGLKFRPFTTSSIQDPTIEAGDCALVYDIKGNMYKTIITNVIFKTGGMTELSCNAEPPARQNSRYINPAAQAVVKTKKKMDDYNAQVAHFNEIASAALGYFKTEEIDADTGATITYLHDNPSLISSQNIVKIASGIIAISDDGGRSYNKGFDASTGTMLLNLIYVHGLTSDWIRTGQLTVGGVDNIDGVIHVVNEKHYASGQYDGSSHIGQDWGTGFLFNYTWLKPAGTYKLTKIIVSNVSSEDDFLDFKYWIQTSTDNGSHWTKVYEDDLIIGDNILSYVMNITSTDDIIYRVLLGKHEILSTDPTFDFEVFTTNVNTIIDNQGVEIKRGAIKLNGKDSFNTSAYGTYMGSEGISFGLYYSDHSDFEVDASTGRMFARKGIIAGYDIDPVDGFKYDTDEYFCQYSKYKIHLGGLWNNDYWTFFGVANKGEFIHLDYGQSTSGGIWITNNGANDMWDFSGDTARITARSIGFTSTNNTSFDFNSNNASRFYSNLQNNGVAYLYLEGSGFAGLIVRSTGIGMGYKYTYLGGSSESDERIKDNIQPLQNESIEKFYKTLEPSTFNFKADPTNLVRYGVIAQNLEEALDEGGLDKGVIIQEDEDGIKSVVYTELIGISLAGVKCLYEKIDEQQAEIDDLKKRIEALETLVNTNK